MSKSYEELEGASGRESIYRPKRHLAKTLFAGPPPQLFFEEEEFEVADINSHGLGAKSRQTTEVTPIPVGRFGMLRMMQRGRTILTAKARKAHETRHAFEKRTGFQLIETQIDLSNLVLKNANVLAKRGQQESGFIDVPAGYRVFCADIGAFLGGYLRRIDDFVAPHEADFSKQDKDETARELAESARAQWRNFLHEGNRLVIQYHEDKLLRASIKAYTENTITQTLVEGPGWARCYYKPAGYPGDFRIMNYGYERNPEGDSVREKFLHLLGMDAAQSIYNRLGMLSTLLLDYATSKAADSQTHLSVTSIGAGPARELREIAAKGAPGQRWAATLIDQDPEALEFALADLRSARVNERVTARGLNISFREMLQPGEHSAQYATSDVIYSSGLFDYLSPLLAQRLLQRLYELVKPGGQIIIGHVNRATTGMIWALEYATDWSLYFRDETQMNALTVNLPEAKSRLLQDPDGGVYFLVIDKPR